MALAVHHAFLKYLDDYSIESLRAALILHWARMNCVSTQLISQGETTQIFLDAGKPAEIRPLLDYLSTWAGVNA